MHEREAPAVVPAGHLARVGRVEMAGAPTPGKSTPARTRHPCITGVWSDPRYALSFEIYAFKLSLVLASAIRLGL